MLAYFGVITVPNAAKRGVLGRTLLVTLDTTAFSAAHHCDFILHIPRYPLVPRQFLILAAPVENQ